MIKVLLVFLLSIAAHAADVPTLWLIGDSTVKNGTKGLMGWGTQLAPLFDSSKIRVENRALGGRSSRSFFREGLSGAAENEMKRGDFLLIQFGHNDGGPIDDGKARASLKGNGEETRDTTHKQSGMRETVHTYGWYLRQYIAGANERGATVIVLSPVPRNIWSKGKVGRNTNDYGKWAAEAAKQGGALFVDLNALIADRYDALGQDQVKAYFPGDHTHTNATGALLNAECVAAGIRGLEGSALKTFLLPPK